MKSLLLVLLFVPLKDSSRFNPFSGEYPVWVYIVSYVVIPLWAFFAVYLNLPSKEKKIKHNNLNVFKDYIEMFIKKMGEIPDWYKIIQKRGNGHAMFAKTMGIKVDDYEYWANAHKEEYILKYNDGNLDVEDVKLRIKKFGYIVSELEKVIKKAAELKLNITHEMHHDYCAARASVVGAEYALKEMSSN